MSKSTCMAFEEAGLQCRSHAESMGFGIAEQRGVHGWQLEPHLTRAFSPKLLPILNFYRRRRADYSAGNVIRADHSVAETSFHGTVNMTMIDTEVVMMMMMEAMQKKKKRKKYERKKRSGLAALARIQVDLV